MNNFKFNKNKGRKNLNVYKPKKVNNKIDKIKEKKENDVIPNQNIIFLVLMKFIEILAKMLFILAAKIISVNIQLII